VALNTPLVTTFVPAAPAPTGGALKLNVPLAPADDSALIVIVPVPRPVTAIQVPVTVVPFDVMTCIDVAEPVTEVVPIVAVVAKFTERVRSVVFEVTVSIPFVLDAVLTVPE